MHLRLAIPLVLAACGARPALTDLAPTLEGRTLVLSVRGPDQRRSLVLESREGEVRQTLLTANSIRLALADQPARDLPFVAADRVGDAVKIRCAPVPEHDISVLVRLDGGEGLVVEVVDKIGLRSSVRELSVAYQLAGQGPAEEVFTPHVHVPPGTLAGDESFHLPLAFLRRGATALSVLADVEHLSRNRRIPQGFQVDAIQATIRHGLFATATRAAHEPAWFLPSTTGVSVRGEDISFSHTVWVRTGPATTLLARAVEDVWLQVAQPLLNDPLRASLVPTIATTKRSLQDCLEPLFHATSLSGVPVGYMPEPDGLGGQVLAGFQVQRQDLLVARALLAAAGPSLPDNHARDLDQAQRLVDLALTLPRRAGMPALRIVQHKDQGEPTFVFTETRLGSEVVPAIDAAWTGYHLLRISEVLPERRERILAACRATARFLIDNQLKSGVIPGCYEPVHLSPRLDLVEQSHGDTAVFALFLAEFSHATGDERATGAARQALRFLEGIDPSGRWPDSEIWRAIRDLGSLEPADQVGALLQRPSSPFAICCGALAALRLLDIAPQSETPVFAGRLLDTLATFQQVWQPPWRPEAVVGGLTGTNIDTTWSSSRQAFAATAFCSHYRRTGRIRDLRRGVAALRAGLESAGTTRLDAMERLARLATAILVAAELRPQTGAAVIDLVAGEGIGVDGVTVSGVRLQPGTLSFDLHTHVVDRGPVELRFSGLRGISTPFAISCNNQPYEELSRDELEAGILCTPRLMPAVQFDPPRLLRAGSTRRLLVRTVPEEAVMAVQLEWSRDGVALGTSNLTRDVVDPALWSLQESPPTEVLRTTGPVWLRAVARGYGQVRAPYRGPVPVTFGEWDEIRLGTETVMEVLDDGDAPVVPFVVGQQSARSLAAKPLVLRIPVAAEATLLQLEVRVAGAIEIRAGGDLRNLLHADQDSVDMAPREISLRLGDRRLWADGVLTVALRRPSSSSGPALVETLRYAEEGRADLPPSDLRAEAMVDPVDELRVLVLPVTMPEAPVSASRTAFEQALLGGSGYRSTPPPKAQRTSGSARELLSQLSGRRTRLEGRVLEPLVLPVHTVAAGATREAVAATLAEAALAHVTPAPDETLVLVHGSDLPGLPSRVIHHKDRAIVLLPERVPLTSKRLEAGSFLPAGDLLDGLLRARFGLPRRHESASGRFGTLALNATGDGHLPASLLGIDLVKAGFADLVRIGPDDGPMTLELSLPTAGRTAVVLSHAALPGRGDLHLEVHGASMPPADGTGAGLLLYWDLPQSQPLLTLGAGRVEPTCLRLSADSWLLPLDAPFVEGGEADLLPRADRLDGDSVPSLATPQGDLLFILRGLQQTGPGRATVEVLPASQNLLRGRATFQVAVGDRGARLGLDGTSPLGGRAMPGPAGLAMATPPVAGASTLAQFPLQPVAGPARLFGVCRAELGQASLVLMVGDREILNLSPEQEDLPFCVELPLGTSPGATLSLRAVADSIGGDTVHVSALRLVPRTPSLHRLPIGLGAPMPVRLHDGVVHGRTQVLAPGNDPAFTAPLVLPGRRAMLRVLAGLPEASPGTEGTRTESTLTIRIRAGDGSVLVTPLQDEVLRAEPRSLRTILMEIPETARGAYRIEFFARGPVPIHLVDVAVDRR